VKTALREKWVKELLSGKYKQGTGRLRRTNNKDPARDTYCCLGVLCDILNPDGWDLYNCHTLKSDDAEYLSEEALKLVGMTRQQQGTLYEMNDNGKTFEEIAAWIKENLRRRAHRPAV
jgi:hypothetical protein